MKTGGIRSDGRPLYVTSHGVDPHRTWAVREPFKGSYDTFGNFVKDGHDLNLVGWPTLEEACAQLLILLSDDAPTLEELEASEVEGW
jgi:hypothetical protein